MLSVNKVTMQYGGKLLFHEVELNLIKTKRYGIVGANGTGKSTFLKILSKEEQPTDGEVNIPRNSHIGFLKQNQFIYEQVKIIDIVLQGKMTLWQALHDKNNIIAKEDLDIEDSYKLADLEEIISLHDGYTAEHNAQNLLVGLGIKAEYHNLPLSALSGGYKLRVLLAQTLFTNPDIMLLDEPTNHLDIVTISWLEDYLINDYNGVLIVISHDRSFLNNLSTHILDIDYGEIREYTGNYNKFVEQKKIIAAHRGLELKNAQKRIAQLQSFVDRFGAKASKAKQAGSKEKMIQKIELPDVEKTSRISPNFKFTARNNPGKLILQVNKLFKAYGEKKVLQNVNFQVTRGEKILFIGPNGIGKSTLLKILTGHNSSDDGTYEWGMSTKISYFAQDHHEALHENIHVIDWLTDRCTDQPISRIRAILGAMLFRKDEVQQNILNLSGGEAARLLFASIILEESNVIILDEPTNHLDVESTEALIEALAEYSGTLLMVSHDRYFAAKLANRIIALTDRGIVDYRGTYEEYLEHYKADYLNSAWLKSQNK